jgi:pimeloyl-ACP methyl ester carboxylesterase
VHFELQTISVRGDKFHVRLQRAGSGVPLLFLHGISGLDQPPPFLEMLAARYEVLAPSHPGWDGSEGLEHVDDIRDLALFYFDLLDELGLEAVHVVGHSLGGMLAAELAALDGSYVRRLVLSNPLGLWLDEEPLPDFFTLSPDALRRALLYDPDRGDVLGPGPDPNDAQAMARAGLQRQLNLAAAGKLIWPIPDKGLKKRLHRIKAPTLIIWGERDGIVPPAYGAEMQRRIAGARLETIERTAHVPMLERPAEFVRLVAGFLEG